MKYRTKIDHVFSKETHIDKSDIILFTIYLNSFSIGLQVVHIGQ